MATLEQIRGQEEMFKSAGFPVEILDLHGTQYPYYVIPADWEKLPQGIPRMFAFQMVADLQTLEYGKPERCSLFGASVTIETDFRPLVVLHEVQEYISIPLEVARSCRLAGTSIPDRPKRSCYKASMAEFTKLQQRDQSFQLAYIEMREQFFRELIPFVTKAGYPSKVIVQFQESTDFWKMLKETGGQLPAHPL